MSVFSELQKAGPAVSLDDITGSQLLAIDRLVDASHILLSRFDGREGITVTHVPDPRCRFCNINVMNNGLHMHREGCWFARLSLASNIYYGACKTVGTRSCQRIVQTAIVYCNELCDFLDDDDAVNIIATDDEGNSNLERLADLYAARDEYLATRQ